MMNRTKLVTDHSPECRANSRPLKAAPSPSAVMARHPYERSHIINVADGANHNNDLKQIAREISYFPETS